MMTEIMPGCGVELQVCQDTFILKHCYYNQVFILQVTNLDPGIESHDVRQLVTSLFSECVAVLQVSVYRLEGGSYGALVKVPGLQEAQLAISQLHKRKIGTKRISITMLPIDGATLPKKEVASLLQSFPGGKIHLVKFRQMFEERFRGSISVADLHR